jgi:hypothetical protein
VKRADFVHQLVLKLVTTSNVTIGDLQTELVADCKELASRVEVLTPFDDDPRVTGPFFLTRDDGKFWSDELRGWGSLLLASAHDRKTAEGLRIAVHKQHPRDETVLIPEAIAWRMWRELPDDERSDALAGAVSFKSQDGSTSNPLSSKT